MKPTLLALIAAFAVPTTALPLAAYSAAPAKNEQAAPAPLSKTDMRYFERLARSNLAEIQASQLAREKAVSGEVKAFASRMMEDHGKMLEEQKTMAKARRLPIPRTPEAAHAKVMKRLQEQSGETFDRSYMTQMVKDHESALDLAQDIADNAKDPELKAAGRKAVPHIRQHLDDAKRIASTTTLPDKVPQPAPKK